jgi:nitrogen fixation protein FixH
MKLRMHWGVAVAVFYTAFALSTVGFVTFAMTRDVELVSADYYQQALSHDRHMQAMANGDALGAGTDATTVAGEVRFRVPAAMARAMRGTATLYRPSDSHADRTTALMPAVDGTIVIPTAGLASGRWQLRVQWSAGGRDYYFERDLRLP